MVYIKLLLAAMFWGGTFIAGKSIAGTVGPFSAAFIRFAIASIALYMIIRKKEGGLPLPAREKMLPVLLLGITGVFTYNIFFFKALHHIEAGRASVIVANNPIFIAFISALVFKEVLNLQKITGILISVYGGASERKHRAR
jgi:drug/metabolite transporter (DMT)-like permease